MRALPLVALLSALAGCLGPLAPEPVSDAALGRDGAAVPGAGAAFAWEGARLTAEGSSYGGLHRLATCAQGTCPNEPVACGEKNCERVPFEVRLGPGERAAAVVSVRWPKTPGLMLGARIEDAEGKVVALGRAVYVDTTGIVARLDEAAPGRYEAVVSAVSGEGGYQAAVRLEPAATGSAARELLPNLVTLPPTDLGLVAPGPLTVGPLVLGPPEASRLAGEATGSQGCTVDETLSRRPTRCLRFSNVVGNVGEGPLEVRLAIRDGATSAAGGGFVQRVHSSDGTFTDTPAGAAEWHATHAHWHNAAANLYSVYGHDLATGARGERINDGNKAGVCFADTGLVDVGLPRTDWPRYSGFSCWNPVPDQSWLMGLSVGWYDIYDWPLADQYVDIGDAPDGVYELCSVTNQPGGLRESDLSDNEACTVFRLEGDAIEVLSPEPYHAERGA